MAWVYLDDQFPDHPKVVAAGDEAAWLFVCGLAYCKRYNTEGAIPKGQVPKLTGHRSPAKLAQRLVNVCLWVDEDDRYRVWDYHDWNKPQVSRSEAARKAARARWDKQADASTDANAYADALPGASEPQSERSAYPDASECPPPHTPVVTSSYNSRRLGVRADDDTEADAAAERAGRDPTVDAALAILAQRDVDERQQADHLPPIGDLAAYLFTATERRRIRHGERLAELAALDPDATPEQLAEALESRTQPLEAVQRPPLRLVPSITDAEVATLERLADQASWERAPEDAAAPHIAQARDWARHPFRPREEKPDAS